MINISANNQIIIDAKTFKIYHIDVDCYAERGQKGKPIGRGKTFEEACILANELLDEYEIVEYGIAFINMPRKKKGANEDSE